MPNAFNLTASLNLQLQGQSVARVRSQIAQGLGGVNANVGVNVSPGGVQQLARVNHHLNETIAAARGATAGVDRLGAAMGRVTLRAAAWATVGAAVYGVASGLRSATAEAVRSAAAFEQTMVRLQHLGATAADVRRVSDEVTRLAKTFGVSSAELAQASLTFKQAGVSAREMGAALEAVSKASLSGTFAGVKETAENSAAAMRVFALRAGELERVLTSIQTLSTKYNATSADLLAAVHSSGAAFKAAGGNLHEFLAILSATRDATAEDAGAIASGMRLIFTRMERPEVLGSLKQLGVDLRDVRGQFVGPLEALLRLRAALQGLPPTDSRFVGVAEQLGGMRNISRLVPLIQNAAEAQKAYNLASLDGVPVAASASRAQGTLLNKVHQLRESWLALTRDITNDRGFRGLAEAALRLADGLVKVVDAARPVLPLLTALAAVRLGQGVGAGVASLLGPRRFATGGVVPGAGDGDTVPAVLSPGEFVLRKRAAQSIGYDTLHAMNRYAGGGEVHLKPGIRVGQLFLDGGEGHERGSVSPERSPRFLRALKMTTRIRDEADLRLMAGRFTFSDEVDAHRLDEARVAPIFRQQVAPKVFGAINDTLRSYIPPQFSSYASILRFEDNSHAVATVEGLLFERFVEALTGVNSAKNDDPFDFSPTRRQIGRFGAVFTPPPVARYLDAKRTRQTPSRILLKALNAGIFEWTPENQDFARQLAAGIGTLREEHLQGQIQAAEQKLAALKGVKKMAWGGYAEPANLTAVADSLRELRLDVEPRGLVREILLARNAVHPQIGGRFTALYSPLAQSVLLNQRRDPGVGDVFHELLHAADHKATGMPSRYASASPGNAFHDVGLLAYRELLPHVWSDYQKRSYGLTSGRLPRDPRILTEGVAWTGSLLAHVMETQLSGKPLSAKATMALARPGVQGLLSRFTEGVLPEVRALSKTPLTTYSDAHFREFMGDFVPQRAVGADLAAVLRQNGAPFARGGSPTDTVPALLTPGEFVFNREAARRIGYGALQHMNANGEVPGYATGGVVRRAGGTPGPGESVSFAYASGRFGSLQEAQLQLADSIFRQVRAMEPGLSRTEAVNRSLLVFQRILDSSAEAERLHTAAVKLETEAALRRNRSQVATGQAQKALLRQAETGEQLARQYREAAEQALSRSRVLAERDASGGLRFLGDPRLQAVLDRRPPPGPLTRFGRNLRENFATHSAFALMTVAPFVADYAEHAGGPAEAAVGRGDLGTAADLFAARGSYTRGKASAGLLTGATVGAGVGMTFGPWGAAAGAFVGGLYGLAGAMHEAEESIRDAKIGNALADIGRNLTAKNANPDAVLRDIRDINLQTSIKAAERSRGLFGLGAVDEDTFAASVRDERNRTFGTQASAITEYLNRAAEDIGKNGAKAGTSLQELERQFREGGRGLNMAYARVLAGLGDLPLDQVLRQLDKVVESSYRTAGAEEQRRKGDIAAGQELAAFHRLTLAVQAAANSLLDMQTAARSTANAFGGSIAPVPVAGGIGSAASLLGAPGSEKEVRAALASLGGPLGAPGRAYAQTGLALDRVSRALPSAISSALSSGAFGEEQAADRIIENLTRQLGGKPDQPTTRLLAVVRAQLSEMKDEELLKDVQADVSGLSRRLLQPVAGPHAEATAELSRGQTQNANDLITGLTENARMLASIQTGQFRRDVTGVQATRFAFETIAAETFQRHNVLGLMPPSFAQAALQRRQEELTGLRGAAAADPLLVGRMLRETTGAMEGARQRRDAALRSVHDEASARAAVGAANEFQTLQTRAASLTQALEHLANASERTASLQERLSHLDEDRESRLSFGERFITADPSARVQMVRGLLLAQQAGRLGTLGAFAQPDQRLILETLGGLGNAMLPGLGRRATDVRELLVSGFAGGVFAPTAGAREEAAGLRQAIGDEFVKAQAAERALIETRRGLQGEFFSRLGQQFDRFFGVLGVQRVSGDIQKTQGEVAARSAEEQTLLRKKEQADLLQGFAPADVDLLKRKDVRDALDRVNTQERARAAQRQAVLGARANAEGIFGKLFGSADSDRLLYRRGAIAGALANATDLTDEQRQQVEADFLRRTTARFIQLRDAGDPRVGTALNGALYSRVGLPAMRGELLPLLRQSLLQARVGKGGGFDPAEESRAVAELSRLVGPQLGTRLTDAASRGNLDKTLKALDAFASGREFADLPGQLKKAEEGLRGLKDRLRELNAELGAQQKKADAGPVVPGVAKAGGGPIAFRPRGTDTVPAMLTPGEFVVNAQAAARHRQLLERINKGTLYAADGGAVQRGAAKGSGSLFAALPDDQLHDVFERARVLGVRMGRSIGDTTDRAKELAALDSFPPGVRQALLAVASQQAAAFGQIEAAGGPQLSRVYAGRVVPDVLRRRRAARALDHRLNAQLRRAQPGSRAALTLQARLMEVLTVEEYLRHFPTGRAAVRGLTRPQLVQLLEDAYRGPTIPAGVDEADYLLPADLPGPQQTVARRRPGPRPAGDVVRLAPLGQRGTEAGAREAAAAAHARQEALRAPTGELNRLARERRRAAAALTADEVHRKNLLALRGFATGGYVDGPDGLDAVPARLTRGEYVLRPEVVSRLGGRRAIDRFANGGAVGGNGGGQGPGVALQIPAGFQQALTSFGSTASTLGQQMVGWQGVAVTLTKALESMPHTIQLQGQHTHAVNVSGLEQAAPALAEGIKQTVIDVVDRRLRETFKNRFGGDAGPL